MINPNNPDFENTPVSPKRPKYEYVLKDTNAKPIVSIITPFYNAGEVFHETAQSIFQQSFQQWEWIIVNDGTTDSKSLEILNKYRNLDDRIRVIDQPSNLGVVEARNKGYKNSTCEYILYLDSDDLIELKTIEYYYWFLETHAEYNFVNSFSVGFGAKSYIWNVGFNQYEKNLEENFIDYSALIRKGILFILNGFDIGYKNGCEDWDFWIRSAANGFWGYTLPEYLKWYRTRLDHSDKWENLRKENLEKLKKCFKLKYPELQHNFPDVAIKPRSHFEPVDTDVISINQLGKNKKRILMILPYLVVGGADTYNLDMLKILINEGWEVSIVTTLKSENNYLSVFSELTPDIFILPNFLKTSDFPKFIKYFVSSRNFDLIMIQNSMFGYMIIPFIRNSFPEIPIIDLNHSLVPEWNDGGYPRVSTLFQKFIDRHIVVSEQIRDWMMLQGISNDKIDVVYWGMDSKKWKHDLEKRVELRNKFGIDENTPVIFYIARLVSSKQPDVFVGVMRKLRDHGVKFKAIVIGDGELREKVLNQIANYDLQNDIIYLGQLNENEIREILNIGDVIFLPSRVEGIPLVFFEGMAIGLVPVGAILGGTAELVTDDCGFLIKRDIFSNFQDEVDAYAKILTNLLLDRARLSVLKNNCRKRIETHFDIMSMNERIKLSFDKALQIPLLKPTIIDYSKIYLQIMVEYSQLQDETNEIWFAKAKLENQLRIIEDKVEMNFWTMPPASTSTYLYFALRQAFYKPFSWLNRHKYIDLTKFKSFIKERLIKV